MGRIIMQSGFDHYDTAHIGERWQVISGSPSIATGEGRTGNALNVAAGAVQRNLPLNYSRLIVGVAFNFASAPPQTLITFTNDDPYIKQCFYITVNSVGAVVLGGTDQYGDISNYGPASANGLVAAGSWYYLEWDMNFASGATIVNLNGLQVIDGSLTANGGFGMQVDTASQVALGSGDNTLMDDFYCIDPSDSTGGVADTFLGDVTVGANVPNGAGRVNNFIPFPNTNPNWENVDEEPPDDDTTYNSSNVVGNVDAYAMATPSGVESIIAICVVADARKDNIGTRIVEIGLGNGTEESYSPDISLADAYQMYSYSFGTNPFTSEAWSPSDLATLQTAIKVTG
jgi:hypothetical protein